MRGWLITKDTDSREKADPFNYIPPLPVPKRGVGRPSGATKRSLAGDEVEVIAPAVIDARFDLVEETKIQNEEKKQKVNQFACSLACLLPFCSRARSLSLSQTFPFRVLSV
jgi:hypothetical protein